jgi:HSP20 family protein
MFSLMPFRREWRVEPAPLDLLRREFASLFDRAFGAWPMPFEFAWDWPQAYGLEMEEKEGMVVVRAEVPGFEASELDVRITGNVMTILAEHKEAPPPEGAKPVEHRYGRLERTVTLPAGAMPDRVEAVYRNGVLEVRVPLAPEAQPKRIEVRT